MEDESKELMESAFRQVGIGLAPTHAVDDSASDFVLDPWDLGVHVAVKRMSLVTVETAQRLINGHRPAGVSDEAIVGFVIADRVTAEARALLMRHNWGYLDLRGHLGLRAGNRMVISSSVDPVWSPPERTAPLAGKAGLEVAAALLMNPGRIAVRELARQLHRSPSTVSTVVASLKREQLIDAELRAVGTRLFWEMVDRWPSERTYLTKAPPAGDVRGITGPLKLGLDDPEHTTGWALSDSAAAAALGAPVAVRSDQPLDFLVPDDATARRARQLLLPTPSRETSGCSIRVAPVAAACSRRLDPPMNYFEWPVAHPLFVALDLAQDKGRGREILEDWNPTTGWKRVW